MVPLPNAAPPNGRVFRTTQWSVVLAASNEGSDEAHAALGTLCQTYWYPLYCCVRRHGYPAPAAQDLTQAFFAKVIEKNQVAQADPERGRFRTFLLRSLENFLRQQHRDATTQKRGGGREVVSWDAYTAEERYASEPLDGASTADVFDRQWAGTLLETVLVRLRHQFSSSGRLELFEHLEPHLWGDDTSTPYVEIGSALSMSTVAVRVTLHRLRQRFHELLREEIASTVATAAEVELELQHLRRALAG